MGVKVQRPPVIPLSERSEAERMAITVGWERFIDSLTAAEQLALLFQWEFWCRPSQQRPPGLGVVNRVWYAKAGRGYGKTRIGSEETRKQIEVCSRIAIVAGTAADARDVMIEGESGIMSVFPRTQRPNYQPSKRRIEFYNGAIGTTYSAEEPERLRGPQHEWAWVDEPASMQYGQAAFDNLMLGLRIGSGPWALLTGTPKPLLWLRELQKDEATVVTRGSTYENIGNLAAFFIRDVLARYEGTRLGAQELYAEDLEDVEGAFWTASVIELGRIMQWLPMSPWPSLVAGLTVERRTAMGFGPFALAPGERRPWVTMIGVDPPGETAECGIVVGTAPKHGRANHDHAVILADESIAGTPEVWGARVVEAYRKHNADGIVVEKNQGGDMVRSTIHAVDPTVKVEKITAEDSKSDRAEPVATLYARGWVHHYGHLGLLESQQTTWVPGEGKSPDRLDACVHLVNKLLNVKPLGRATVHAPT